MKYVKSINPTGLHLEQGRVYKVATETERCFGLEGVINGYPGWYKSRFVELNGPDLSEQLAKLTEKVERHERMLNDIRRALNT